MSTPTDIELTLADLIEDGRRLVEITLQWPDPGTFDAGWTAADCVAGSRYVAGILGRVAAVLAPWYAAAARALGVHDCAHAEGLTEAAEPSLTYYATPGPQADELTHAVMETLNAILEHDAQEVSE